MVHSSIANCNLHFKKSCSGVVGIRITIMLPENSDKKSLPQYRLPDNVKVLEPGEEKPEKEAPSRKHTSGRIVCRRQPRPHYRPV